MKQTIKEFEQTLSSEERVLFQYQVKVNQYLTPYLLDQFKMEDELGRIALDKGTEGSAFDYDMAVDRLLDETLIINGYQGSRYSEETKWKSYGDSDDVILVDPICNSLLLRRGFRNVGSGVTWFRGVEFIAGIVTEFSTNTMCIADRTRTLRVRVRGDEVVTRPAQVSGKKDLEMAFVVYSLYSEKARTTAIEQRRLIEKLPLIVDVFGGQPQWARLSQGSIDAYINPVLGTKIYEMAASEIARRAGAVIRDLNGNDIFVGKHINTLHTDEKSKLPFIAAASEELFEALHALSV